MGAVDAGDIGREHQERLDELLRRVVKAASEGPAEEKPNKNGLQVIAKEESGDSMFFVIRLKAQALADLSPREREIVDLVGDGLSNKEIAKRLGISTATVAAHIRRIFTKLHVKSRIELVRLKILLS